MKNNLFNSKKGAGPAIIWIIISISAFCAIMVLSINSYVDLMNSNNCGPGTACQIDPAWQVKYSAFNAEQAKAEATTNNMSNNIVTSILQTASALVGTVFNIGSSAIQGLGQGSQQSISIIQLIQGSLPVNLKVLFGFILLSVTLYIAVQTLRELRGSLVGT